MEAPALGTSSAINFLFNLAGDGEWSIIFLVV